MCSHRQIQLFGDVQLSNEDAHLVVSILLSGRAPRREVQTDLRHKQGDGNVTVVRWLDGEVCSNVPVQ